MNLKDKSCLVYDHSLYVELALRLARDYGKVYYCNPIEKSCPSIQDHCVGDGFPELHLVDSVWDVFDSTDLFVFPDVQGAALQRHLESLGKRVWGSRRGDMLELKRVAFKQVMEKLGMAVGDYTVIEGLDKLRDYLKANEDKFIKVSKYRGDMESWHHITYDLSQPKLDELAVKFGPLQNDIPFLVEDPIPTEIEVGYDGFCIDGRFPVWAMQGYEGKDKCLIASVMDYDDLPEEIRDVNESLSGILREAKYRNFFSTEIRVNGKPYLIDPTCRMPCPSGEIQQEIWGNLSEVIWAGSGGELLDPEPTAKFGVEVIIQHKHPSDSWRVINVPDHVKQWVKLFGACKQGNLYAIPPNQHMGDSIGAVVGLGDTVEDAIDELNSICDALGNQPITIDRSSLMDTLRVIGEAEDKGIKFSDQELPAPEEAVK